MVQIYEVTSDIEAEKFHHKQAFYYLEEVFLKLP